MILILILIVIFGAAFEPSNFKQSTESFLVVLGNKGTILKCVIKAAELIYVFVFVIKAQ